AVGLLMYAIVGFSLMYPGKDFAGAWFGFSGFGVNPPANALTPAYNAGYTYWTDFIFQAMFAATAVTIISGAVAERIKLFTFLIFAVFYAGFCYPVVGMWKWGGGFLQALATPFYDFAGSSIVHSVGGWGALAGAIVLGPRIGKYKKDGVIPIPGHNMPLATTGVFLLWFGWFGFNGGSVLSANPGIVSLVFVTTSIAAAAGAMGAFIASYALFKTNDLTMVLNGILAGLVSITAGADQMSVGSSAIIGFIGGVLAVFAVLALDKLKIDDPVGAIPVHLGCGIWGTLAVGIFGNLAGGAQIMSQLIGIGVIGAFCFAVSFGAFFLLNKTMGLRVSETEEVEGLDINEHGMRSYSDFVVNED
ncbi:MAG: ammonium transporter, partial [Bacteroidetes bacterium]